MGSYKTEQENFWAGSFGESYVSRNRSDKLHVSNINLFRKIFSKIDSINSVLEFGANIGMNLRAIRHLYPSVEISALEINEEAARELEELKCSKIYAQSIFDFSPDYSRDFVFTKGFLIHLSPDHLREAYRIIYESSARYICIAEYYNPVPVAIPYRGHTDKLFKRDFCGELLDCYSDLELLDYGFSYHRDNNFPQDDISWFLLEKSGGSHD